MDSGATRIIRDILEVDGNYGDLRAEEYAEYAERFNKNPAEVSDWAGAATEWWERESGVNARTGIPFAHDAIETEADVARLAELRAKIPAPDVAPLVYNGSTVSADVQRSPLAPDPTCGCPDCTVVFSDVVPDPEPLTFTLEIRLGNAGMRLPEDVAAALREASMRVDWYSRFPDDGVIGSIRDVNGNTVGSWAVK